MVPKEVKGRKIQKGEAYEGSGIEAKEIKISV
jgi:hypothetical protein